MTPGAPTRMPLKQATIRIADELESLHERLERLEFGLEAVFAHSRDGLEGQTIGMIQELDMLRQSLAALAMFMGQAAEQTDKHGQSDLKTALASMPLRDMASRLSGSHQTEATSGHAELF